jgi:hypothetical protein
MIKGKTAEEIRKTFNITNDFTPEEEAQIKKENVSIDCTRVVFLLTLFIGMGRRPINDLIKFYFLLYCAFFSL